MTQSGESSLAPLERIESIIRAQPRFSESDIRAIVATCVDPLPTAECDLDVMVAADETWIPRTRRVDRLEALEHRLREALVSFLIQCALDTPGQVRAVGAHFESLKAALSRVQRAIGSGPPPPAGESHPPTMATLVLHAAIRHNDGRRGARGQVHGGTLSAVAARSLAGLDAFDAAVNGVRMLGEWLKVAERRDHVLRTSRKTSGDRAFEVLIVDLATIWTTVLGQKLIATTENDHGAVRCAPFVAFVQAMFRPIGIRYRDEDIDAIVSRLKRQHKLRPARTPPAFPTSTPERAARGRRAQNRG